MVREATKKDLDEILQLYLYLHEESVPEDTGHLRRTWENIINDLNHHLIVCEVDNRIVASCVWLPSTERFVTMRIQILRNGVRNLRLRRRWE